jgi:hypothetical protein
MKESKSRELLEELRLVLAGRKGVADTLLPPLIFLGFNGFFGYQTAAWSALGLAIFLSLLRLIRRQPVKYAWGGLAGVLVAMLLAWLSGSASGYFLPGMFSGGLTLLACLISVLSSRPLVAWTSYLTRRWPINWYWHPRVRPAYDEVTLAWALFFGLRLGLQWLMYEQEATSLLALTQLLSGWPATILLLLLSYLYGTWRLRQLQGPSVAEFAAGSAPPWSGQQRGF